MWVGRHPSPFDVAVDHVVVDECGGVQELEAQRRPARSDRPAAHPPPERPDAEGRAHRLPPASRSRTSSSIRTPGQLDPSRPAPPGDRRGTASSTRSTLGGRPRARGMRRRARCAREARYCGSRARPAVSQPGPSRGGVRCYGCREPPARAHMTRFQKLTIATTATTVSAHRGRRPGPRHRLGARLSRVAHVLRAVDPAARVPRDHRVLAPAPRDRGGGPDRRSRRSSPGARTDGCRRSSGPELAAVVLVFVQAALGRHRRRGRARGDARHAALRDRDDAARGAREHHGELLLLREAAAKGSSIARVGPERSRGSPSGRRPRRSCC